MSYIWEARESGYSDYARWVVIEGLSKLEKCVSAGNIAYIHRIDSVLFSHAGLTEVFVSHFLPDFSGGIDELLEKINGFRRDELWCDASPIWARPQDGRIEMYPKTVVKVTSVTNTTVFFIASEPGKQSFISKTKEAE